MMVTVDSLANIKRLALVTIAVATAGAQNPPLPGDIEFGGFTGISQGLDHFRAMGGANGGYAFLPRNFGFMMQRVIMGYGEFSYFPGIRRTITTHGVPTGSCDVSVPLSELHGGIHVRAPLRESNFAPYFSAGVGHLYFRERTALCNIPSGLGSNVAQPVPIPSETSFAPNFGGGIRFFFSARVGVQFEVKLYHPTGRYAGNFAKYTAGILFKFRRPYSGQQRRNPHTGAT